MRPQKIAAEVDYWRRTGRLYCPTRSPIRRLHNRILAFVEKHPERLRRWGTCNFSDFEAGAVEIRIDKESQRLTWRAIDIPGVWVLGFPGEAALITNSAF